MNLNYWTSASLVTVMNMKSTIIALPLPLLPLPLNYYHLLFITIPLVLLLLYVATNFHPHFSSYNCHYYKTTVIVCAAVTITVKTINNH